MDVGLFFEFDGVKSTQFGIEVVRFNEGRVATPLWGSASVSDQSTLGRHYMDSYNVKRDPIQISMTIMKVGVDGQLSYWTPEDISIISRWLVHDEFKELRLGQLPHRIYYAMITNPGVLNHTHTHGYLELTFTTNSAYAWSPVEFHKFQNAKNGRIEFSVSAQHAHHEWYYPEWEIIPYGGTSYISIENKTTKEKTMITKLTAGEGVYINGENRYIQSLNHGSSLFGNFNRVWPRLRRGNNDIVVTAKDLIFKAQYPIL